MKISINWVRQFTKITLEHDQLVRRIGAQLGAVEKVEYWGGYFDERIVVAEVKGAKEHTNADTLSVYQLQVGTGQIRQVVAGDTTLKVGDLVAYIPPGAAIPQSIFAGTTVTIEERELRGEMSHGMMGSGQELLLNNDHTGVQRLPEGLEVGTPLKSLFGLDDYIIDVENKMFTHRPDCFGIMGVAREIAAIQGTSFESPKKWLEQAAGAFEVNGDPLKLRIENQVPEKVPRLTAVALRNVNVGPSPLEMQSFLLRVGIRPINNVVDITNYVMHETAQPLHAFDYDKLVAMSGSQDELCIVARNARKNESLKLLDGKTIQLEADDVVIATEEHAVSVAGCIGGIETEVDEQTKRIVLEAGNFDLYSIRRTSFRHGLFTDAVTRFNKGQSPEQCARASDIAVALLMQETGAAAASQRSDSYPNSYTNSEVTVTAKFVNDRLASDFETKDIAQILQRTEFNVDIAGDSLCIVPPFWRTDIDIKEDIVEEVGRLTGFDNLPIALPIRPIAPQRRSLDLRRKHKAAEALQNAGAQEVYTYNFVSKSLFEKTGTTEVIPRAYAIRNSLSPDLQLMRVSILPSLLQKVYQNIRNGFDHFQLFEINKCHDRERTDDAGLPIERMVVAGVVAAQRGNDSEVGNPPYYHARALFDQLVKRLGAARVRIDKINAAPDAWSRQLQLLFNTERSGEIIVNGHSVGFLGEISQHAATSLKVPRFCAGFEVDMHELYKALDKQTYIPLSKYPSTTQDVTFSDSQGDRPFSTINEHVYQAVVKFSSTDVRLEGETVSIYQNERGAMHITFRFVITPYHRTLKNADIKLVIANVTNALEAQSYTVV